MIRDYIHHLLLKGAGVTINATSYLPDDLHAFARTAASTGGTLTIKNANKIHIDHLNAIAFAGKNSVIFDFT